MVNRSKAESPQMWERWQKSGAVGTSKEELGRREEKEKADGEWLKQLFSLDDSSIPEDTRTAAMQ